MRREDLKAIDLTAEQIDQIMKLHGKDTESLKARYSDYDSLKSQNEEYSKQIAKNDADLKKLAKLTKDNEDLNGKVTSLQDENKQAKADYEEKIQGMKLNGSIDSVLSEHKARNSKAVKALLDMDSIKLDEKGNLTGLDDQLATIEKDNGFLFDKGTKPNYEPKGNEGGDVSDIDKQAGQLDQYWDSISGSSK